MTAAAAMSDGRRYGELHPVAVARALGLTMTRRTPPAYTETDLLEDAATAYWQKRAAAQAVAS